LGERLALLVGPERADARSHRIPFLKLLLCRFERQQHTKRTHARQAIGWAIGFTCVGRDGLAADPIANVVMGTAMCVAPLVSAARWTSLRLRISLAAKTALVRSRGDDGPRYDTLKSLNLF
jgi:hypothetical protein